MSQADASAGSPLPSAVRGASVASPASAGSAGSAAKRGPTTPATSCSAAAQSKAGGSRADRGQLHGADHQVPYGFVARRVLQRDRGLRDGLVVPPLRQEQFGEVQPQRHVFGSGGDSGPQATDER